MATCSKCGMNIDYAEPHLCEGRDRTKWWVIVAVTAGTLVGGRLGLAYGAAKIAEVCSKPDAGNLCGLIASYAVPGWIVVGAVLGGFVSTLGVALAVARRRA